MKSQEREAHQRHRPFFELSRVMILAQSIDPKQAGDVERERQAEEARPYTGI
ncbi:hypothetical protein [Halothiobacillus sp.]|uniref:hypothetical protein n=1 Tax=Halothiobacillus sp. TaxID=1891311 RepID=UPI002AD2FA80|nr:hypothetical protein [Halothiobacillus sp.]